MSLSLDTFDDGAKRAVVAAQKTAHAAGTDEIGVVHLICGALEAAGAAAIRLADLGLTADVARAWVGALQQRAELPPMSRREAKELRAQLRMRGLGPAKAEALVERIRATRRMGPVAFDAGARALLEACVAEGDTSAAGILRRAVASAPDAVRTLLERAGCTGEDVLRALDTRELS